MLLLLYIKCKLMKGGGTAWATAGGKVRVDVRTPGKNSMWVAFSPFRVLFSLQCFFPSLWGPFLYVRGLLRACPIIKNSETPMWDRLSNNVTS